MIQVYCKIKIINIIKMIIFPFLPRQGEGPSPAPAMCQLPFKSMYRVSQLDKRPFVP